MIPKHATLSIGQFIEAVYFSPPSSPERPVQNVIAYWAGKQYYFKHNAHAEDWQLIDIK